MSTILVLLSAATRTLHLKLSDWLRLNSRDFRNGWVQKAS